MQLLCRLSVRVRRVRARFLLANGPCAVLGPSRFRIWVPLGAQFVANVRGIVRPVRCIWLCCPGPARGAVQHGTPCCSVVKNVMGNVREIRGHLCVYAQGVSTQR